MLSWFSWSSASKTDAAEKVNNIAEEKFVEIIDAVKAKVLKELGTITPSEELEVIYLDILREGCSLFHQIARGKLETSPVPNNTEPSTSTTQELTAHAKLFEATVFETVKKYVDRQVESLRLANTTLEQKNKFLEEQKRNKDIQAEELEHLNGRLKRTVCEQERTIAALRSQVEELRDIQRRVEESIQRITFLEQQERKILESPVQGQLSPVVYENSNRKEFLFFPAKKLTSDITRDQSPRKSPGNNAKIVEKVRSHEDLLLFEVSPPLKADDLQILNDIGPDGSSHSSVSFEDI